MGERFEVGVLDTSVIIDLDVLSEEVLPLNGLISAVTLAELSAGPHLGSDAMERARRQRELQSVEAVFEPVVFGAEAARAYGHVVAASVARGRKVRRRMADLMIAATAVSEDVPLFTRNPSDFQGLEALLKVVAV